MKKNKKSNNLRNNKFETTKPLYLLAFMGLWGLVFFPPFFQGLFFPAAQKTTLICALVVFSIWWFVKVKDDEGVDILNNPMDWLVVGLIISYIIASFGAFSQQLAVNGIVKQLLYFNVFWLASRLVIDYKSNVSLINVTIISAVFVSLAGLFTAMGWIYIHTGFIDGRIYSTLQYPNTLAGYLLAVSILALGLWQNSQKNFRYVYIVLIYIMMVVFIGTNSRGAFLILPVVLALTLANPWLKNKIESFLLWVIIMVASVIAGTGFIGSIAGDNIGLALLWVFIGMALVIAGQFALEMIRDKEIIKPSWPQGKILLIGLIIIFAMGIFSWQTILPDHIADRFATVSLYDTSSGARIYWSMEAINIANNEGPIFGLGGGAWQASFRYFQSYYYHSTQVHNDFAQILMEVGYTGLLLFVSLWFVMFYLAYKNFKVIDDRWKNIQWAVIIAAVCLGGRGLMDFDFAFGAINILLFVLFAITLGIYRQHHPYKIWLKGATVPIVAVSAVLIIAQLVLPATLIVANNNVNRGLDANRAGDINATIHYYERAATFNPFSANFRIDLARFYFQQGELEKAEEAIQAAIARDRYNYVMYRQAASIYFEMGNLSKAVEFKELTRDRNRWNQRVWNDLAQMYYFAGILLMQDGRHEEARVYLERASQMPADISAQMDALGDWENALWTRSRLTTSPTVYLYSGVGHYFFDNLEIAEDYFNRAFAGIDEYLRRAQGFPAGTVIHERYLEQAQTLTEALWWLALIKERQGQPEAMNVFYQRALAESPGFESNFRGIRVVQETWWNRN